MLTLVYAYYRNPQMLSMQYRVWRGYDELLDRVRIIVVDDGSPEPAADVPRPDLPIKILRVKEDIPWHQDGARNLGASVADDGMCFFGDMDHVLTKEGLVELLGTRDSTKTYRFPRELVNKSKEIRPAVNVFACHRQIFWATGGYDERYSGCYGSDQDFRKKLEAVSVPKLLTVPLQVYLPEDIPDCRTHGLERTGPENARKLADARERSRGRPPVVLDFDWEQVV